MHSKIISIVPDGEVKMTVSQTMALGSVFPDNLIEVHDTLSNFTSDVLRDFSTNSKINEFVIGSPESPESVANLESRLVDLSQYSSKIKSIVVSPTANLQLLRSIFGDKLSITSNICFPKGTMVHCDQGWVEIQKLQHKNTFGGHRVVAVTETTCVENCLIEFTPYSVTTTAPIRRLRVSKNHVIKQNGILRKAKDIAKGKEVPYKGQVYNVLLDVHGLINVEGLECETLHPGNNVATMYSTVVDFT